MGVTSKQLAITVQITYMTWVEFFNCSLSIHSDTNNTKMPNRNEIMTKLSFSNFEIFSPFFIFE